MSIRPWVNYHHLLYFKTIAMEGGIAKAAKKLRLGQPTLSTQLKQFERVLGQDLFDRSKRQLQLTEPGRLVLGYALEIFKLGDEMLAALAGHFHDAKVHVHIGVTDSIAKHLSMRIFEYAKKTAPCVVSLTEGHSDELLRELRAHRVDLVVSNAPPPVGDSAAFYAKCIAKMPVIVCGSKKFAKLKRGFPESLKDQPFILPTMQSKMRHDVEHFFKLRDQKINIAAEIQDTALQKLLAMHGHGLIPIAKPAVEEHLRSKDLIVIGALPDIYEEFWFIAAQRKMQNLVALSLLKTFHL